ncbi:MAG: hypothetical protein K2J90_11965 [Lachnospiraceae bacterium]|nr:hypothetical protein [Lachnospiraceae bacterium]
MNITPPVEAPPTINCLSLDPLKNYKQGRSIKPGNVTLNIKHLIDTLTEIVTATVSLIGDITILKVCAAISIWKMLKEVFTIEIKKEQAIVIIALWKNCNEGKEISLEYGYNNTNLLCKQIHENEIAWEQYVDLMEELDKIKCIVLEENGVRLCEYVSKEYID